jgi:glycolate oxidase iron-sulfur subunit
MSSVETLARLLRELEDQLVVCMKCGMCQAVCPVFDRTGRESDVARGKLALLEGLVEKMIRDPEGVRERLDRCLLCGSCAANCPSGVSVLEIFIKARAILSGYLGLSAPKKAILRGMVAHPRRFDRIMGLASRLQKLGSRPASELLETSCARFASPLIGDRHFKNLAPTPFHKMLPDLDLEKNRTGPRVGIFTGCLIDKFYPRIALSMIRALHHHGAVVVIPDNQGCCGIPALSSGDMDTFHRLVAHNLELFEAADLDCLVTACATCTATLHELWPVMTRDRSGLSYAALKRIAEKTLDISQFLVSKPFSEDTALADDAARIPVTYHDPCHLKKSLGVAAEPRELIRRSPKHELVEMTDADTCCGMGGSFNLLHYDISASIGDAKRDRILETGAEIVATGCPACMMQISDTLSRAGKRVAVRHPVELYAENIR